MTDTNNHTGRDDADIPEYLRRWPGLYVYDRDQLVKAPEEDCLVARSYPTWADKGSLFEGKRLTLLTKRTTYQVDEQIRVLHVVDVSESGHSVYVIGPKEIYGEYVDGKLVTEPLPMRDDPLIPRMYSGAVLPSPAVDYNYEITTYTFSEPGTHQIYWKLGSLQSNILTLAVTIGQLQAGKNLGGATNLECCQPTGRVAE